MAVVKKLLAVFLIGTALVVAVHFVFNSFYREALDTVDVWAILDWPIGVATLIALVVNYQGKRAIDQDANAAVTREYVAAGVRLTASVLLALWFFSNWFNFLNAGADGETVANQVVWVLVDALVVLVLGATGRYLWREADSA